MIQRELDAAVAKRLDSIVAEHHMADPPDVVRAGPMKRRRGFVAQDYSGLATLTLVRDDGLLRLGPSQSMNSASRRRRPIG
jgi:hypothetical protein